VGPGSKPPIALPLSSVRAPAVSLRVHPCTPMPVTAGHRRLRHPHLLPSSCREDRRAENASPSLKMCPPPFFSFPPSYSSVSAAVIAPPVPPSSQRTVYPLHISSSRFRSSRLTTAGPRRHLAAASTKRR
jgi:hypothetical protein